MGKTVPLRVKKSGHVDLGLTTAARPRGPDRLVFVKVGVSLESLGVGVTRADQRARRMESSLFREG